MNIFKKALIVSGILIGSTVAGVIGSQLIVSTVVAQKSTKVSTITIDSLGTQQAQRSSISSPIPREDRDSPTATVLSCARSRRLYHSILTELAALTGG